MDIDKYGEIINGKETYKEINRRLRNNESVIIGWTDENMTHYDILFTHNPYKQEGNYLQRGLRGYELYVSIIRT